MVETEGNAFKRDVFAVLIGRLREPRRFIQVLAGPRQTGKTTVARQVLAGLWMPSHYATADEPMLRDREWLSREWEIAREKAGGKGGVFVLDEAQKIPGWSETVKRLWDEDAVSGCPLRVVLLGSSPLLVRHGTEESLAGRFERIPVTHWSLAEMHAAFGWNADRYVYYGGYPGAVTLVGDRERWARYVLDSIIEPSISRDIQLMARVEKPALLRQLFHLACDYSGQVLSYQKMLGQLRDAGNTDVLAGYLRLLEGAGMAAGLERFSGSRVRQRGSIPKLQVLNTAAMTATSAGDFEAVRGDSDRWGRLVESAVGAHLLNAARIGPFEVFYWREGKHEVDFVIRRGKDSVAIEVKGGLKAGRLSGLAAFTREHKPTRSLVVGGGGIPLEEFLLTPPADWFRAG